MPVLEMLGIDAIFPQNMDFLTAENDCKWGFAEPEYYGCTMTLEFAESCNMDYRLIVHWTCHISLT